MRAEQLSTWAAQSSGGGSAWTLLLPVLLLALFYFVAIRPQRRRQREQVDMQSRVQPGQQVITTTGLYATVVAVENDAVVLEVAPGVHSRYVKAAIGRVVDPAAAADATTESSDTAAEATDTTEQADSADATDTAKTDDKPGSAKASDAS